MYNVLQKRASKLLTVESTVQKLTLSFVVRWANMFVAILIGECKLSLYRQFSL
jgi:hypothetical protein